MADTPLILQLNKLLANSYALMLKTQNYHWNYTGANFYGIHTMLDEQYNELFTAIDEIAEHIRSLGSLVPAALDEYDRQKIIQNGDPTAAPMQMLLDLAGDHSRIIEMLQEVITLSDTENDAATSDLLTDRVRSHIKSAWMLRSSAK